MNIEQERAAFEAWHIKKFGKKALRQINSDKYAYASHQGRWETWKDRAAMQSQSINGGWKEAAIAWEVCASLHREYCKGKDPFFKTRQTDFVRHADDARKRFSEPNTPQTKPQAEPSEWLKQHEALMHRVSKAALVVGYGGTINGATAEQALDNAEKALLDHALALQSQDAEDAERLDWLDKSNSKFRMGWYVGVAPVGIVSIQPVVTLGREPTPIREAIDHARCIEGGK